MNSNQLLAVTSFANVTRWFIAVARLDIFCVRCTFLRGLGKYLMLARHTFGANDRYGGTTSRSSTFFGDRGKGLVSYNLGIDVGNTYVAVALARATAVEMFHFRDHAVVTPATVHLRDDGTLATDGAIGVCRIPACLPSPRRSLESLLWGSRSGWR
jgi:hypothetical protein